MIQPPAVSASVRTAIVAAVILVIAGLAGLARSKNTTDQAAQTAEPTSTATPAAQATAATDAAEPIAASPTPFPTAQASAYKDGSYTASGSYRTPESTESIKVTVTLAGGVVTDASVTQQAVDRTSSQYQQKFAAGFKQFVVGKPIDEVSLNVVSGSSLTPKGFNAALATIKAQAS